MFPLRPERSKLQKRENLQKEWHMLAYVIFLLYLCSGFVVEG